MVDLSGQAKVRWVTKVSNFHRIQRVVKLADGTFLVGDYAGGSTIDWREEEFFFTEIRWVKLDPESGTRRYIHRKAGFDPSGCVRMDGPDGFQRTRTR